MFGDYPAGPIKPVTVGGVLQDVNQRKMFRRIRCRIAEWLEQPGVNQHRHIMGRHAQQVGGLIRMQPSGQSDSN